MQTLVVILGTAIMIAVAAFMDWFQGNKLEKKKPGIITTSEETACATTL